MESIGLVKKFIGRTSLVVQRLGLRASKAGGSGSITVQVTKIPHAVWCSQKKKSSLGLCMNIFQKNPNELFLANPIYVIQRQILSQTNSYLRKKITHSGKDGYLTCVKKERNVWDQILEKGMMSEFGSLLRGSWYQGLGHLSPAPVPLLTVTSSKLLSHLRSEPPLQNGDWIRSFLFRA